MLIEAQAMLAPVSAARTGEAATRPPRPHDLANRFRRRRMKEFLDLAEPLRRPGRTLRILDVGGTPGYWHALADLYLADDVEITIVNLGQEERDDGNLRLRAGDACRLPFADDSFDIVHSNSVIEHVGRWPEMSLMAAEVRRLAPSYFVQTPNFWFPVEPHFKLPIVHWLPEPARIAVLKAVGRMPRSASPAESRRAVRRIFLIGARQLATLFPDAEIWREKVAGLTKSLVARRATR
jgi:SAM-dependent methyltransferase